MQQTQQWQTVNLKIVIVGFLGILALIFVYGIQSGLLPSFSAAQPAIIIVTDHARTEHVEDLPRINNCFNNARRTKWYRNVGADAWLEVCTSNRNENFVRVWKCGAKNTYILVSQYGLWGTLQDWLNTGGYPKSRPIKC